MGRRPNTMLQIRFADDEAGTFFWKLAEEQGVTRKQFNLDGEDPEEPYFEVKIGDNSFTFQLYNGDEENYEHGVSCQAGFDAQTIGYDYVTSDWQEAIDIEPLLIQIIAAREWADHTAARLGTKFKLTIGANYY